MTLTQIFAKVLNMSLTASLVIVLVIAARFVLRKSPKVFSYALWAVVLFRLLCPVSLPSPVSLLGLLDAPVAQSEGITTTVEYIPYKVVEAAAENPQPDQLPQNTVTQAPTQSQQTMVEPQREPLSAAEIMTYIWLAGIAVMVIVGVGSYLRFRKHLTVAMQVKDNIYLVDHIDSAFVAGLIRPKVYLPSDIPLKQMGYIIAHEQYHIRRLDHVTKHLSFAALCIHWFNPFVWVAFILSGKDLEMSCDEAVIKRLGEGIRADYSASLLSLATGRRIIAGTPLAFGEGDTKGRINNMAKWKQPKKWVSIVSFILCFSILTACAANPTQNVVTSKNDGAFEENMQQTAPNETVATIPVEEAETFLSTDGSAEYRWRVEQTITQGPLPVVEIGPNYLTGDEVQRVIEAVLPNAVIYEHEPQMNPNYSKAEYQQAIDFLIKYGTEEAQNALHANEIDFDASYEVELFQKYIERYQQLMETAPEEVSRSLCQWEFYKNTHYMNQPTDLQIYSGSNAYDMIFGFTEFDGIEYTIDASTRNENDYKMNRIGIQVGGGLGIPDREIGIYRSILCTTPEPTQAQVDAVTQKVQSILSEIDMGQWTISNVYIQAEEYGENTQYTIVVQAVPEFEGVPALYGQKLIANTSEDNFAPNYPIAKMEFYYSADGKLAYFDLNAPIETIQTINTNVAILPIEELISKAENYLSLFDAMSGFGTPGDVLSLYQDAFQEKILCRVDITQVCLEMARIRVPNTDDRYYYTPALVVKGSAEYYGEKTGMVYMRSSDYFPGGVTLAIVNAVDGSIIAQ